MNTKVKIFKPSCYFDDLQKEVNKFIENKEVIIDIKITSTKMEVSNDNGVTNYIYQTIMVVYKEKDVSIYD